MQLNFVSTVPLKARPLPVPDQALDCIRKNITSLSRQVILCLFSPFETHLQCCGQFWVPQQKQDTDVLRLLQCRSPQRWLRDQNISPTSRVWEGWDYSGRRRESSGRVLTTHINIWGRTGVKKLEPNSSEWSPKKGTRSNGHKLKYMKFHLKIRISI